MLNCFCCNKKYDKSEMNIFNRKVTVKKTRYNTASQEELELGLNDDTHYKEIFKYRWNSEDEETKSGTLEKDIYYTKRSACYYCSYCYENYIKMKCAVKIQRIFRNYLHKKKLVKNKDLVETWKKNTDIDKCFCHPVPKTYPVFDYEITDGQPDIPLKKIISKCIGLIQPSLCSYCLQLGKKQKNAPIPINPDPIPEWVSEQKTERPPLQYGKILDRQNKPFWLRKYNQLGTLTYDQQEILHDKNNLSS